MSKRVRHILNLSGGKDSTALAIYLRDRIPDLEYVFYDTEKELPETYDYLDLVEAYLGKKVIRLRHDGRGFDHWLAVYRGYLPSTRMRWCTKHLKIRPFEHFVGDDNVVTYIGIRADEDRTGYLSSRPNIRARYPFKEDGITKQDVLRILKESGLGMPSYYHWRSRSGCYFCFFQQKIEWVGLLEKHPNYYLMAQSYEKLLPNGTRYTWNGDESLEELSRPERIAEIKAEHERRMALESKRQHNRSLMEVALDNDTFASVIEGYQLDDPCIECSV